jgi:hypothetical protein
MRQEFIELINREIDGELSGADDVSVEIREKLGNIRELLEQETFSPIELSQKLNELLVGDYTGWDDEFCEKLSKHAAICQFIESLPETKQLVSLVAYHRRTNEMHSLQGSQAHTQPVMLDEHTTNILRLDGMIRLLKEMPSELRLEIVKHHLANIKEIDKQNYIARVKAEVLSPQQKLYFNQLEHKKLYPKAPISALSQLNVHEKQEVETLFEESQKLMHATSEKQSDEAFKKNAQKIYGRVA